MKQITIRALPVWNTPNVRSHRGPGDAQRTLAACRLLAADHDDVAAKAQAWALRELMAHDPAAVEASMRARGHTGSAGPA